jgi:hypothetical protein
MSSDLVRVKYVSQFSREIADDEIRALVEKSAENNSRHNITGILMATGRIFYQVLEGPKEVVFSLYSRILRDDRHKDVLLLSEENQVSKRFFGDWSMRAVSTDSIADDRLKPVRKTLESIVDKRREMDRSAQLLERTVWGELHRIMGLEKFQEPDPGPA